MSISWSRAGEWFAGSTRDAACTGELREEAGLLIEELEAELKPELEDEASEAGELNIFLGVWGVGERGRELAWLDGLIYTLGPEKKQSGWLRSESGEMMTQRRCHPRSVGPNRSGWLEIGQIGLRFCADTGHLLHSFISIPAQVDPTYRAKFSSPTRRNYSPASPRAG
ncbi:hypothetical protein B0H17DRAFT_1125647 [Mycena rosella]|uniref:Uncharacterized protein n=1 Tax=Mycena rosella TaxID=1033263 RepID=A0AAD7GWI1_MYCRO|nr:hypothetical protein B0H17DRAFT_1125647 [Mycena rosella]